MIFNTMSFDTGGPGSLTEFFQFALHKKVYGYKPYMAAKKKKEN